MEDQHKEQNPFETKWSEITDWFEKYKEASEAYAGAYRMYEEFKRVKPILDQIPENEQELKNRLEGTLYAPLSAFREALGPTLTIDQAGLQYSGASASTGSATILNELKDHQPSDTNWYTEYMSLMYSTVQEANRRRTVAKT